MTEHYRPREFNSVKGIPRKALWVSTSRTTRGGVASYVRNAECTELWKRWNIHHIATHGDGSNTRKIAIFLHGVVCFLISLAGRPDIIHFHASARGSFLRKALLVHIARLARVPIVLHIHDGTFEDYYRHLGKAARAFVRRTLEGSDVVLALGPRWTERLQTIAPRADVRSLPNGTSNRSSRPAAQPQHGVHVLFIGQLSEPKGVFDLIHAWGRMTGHDGPHGPRLTLAGDGDLERVRSLVATLPNRETVHVTGWLEPDAVSALLTSAHVLVLPSTHEGQPMSVIEAMAHGLCVIASDVGGIPDLVEDGQSALLVPPNNVELLTEAMQRALDDVDLRTTLGSKAWETSEEFDLRTLTARIDDLYRELLVARRSPAPGGHGKIGLSSEA